MPGLDQEMWKIKSHQKMGKKNGEKFREIDSFHLKIFLAAELFLNFLVQCVNNSSSMW